MAIGADKQVPILLILIAATIGYVGYSGTGLDAVGLRGVDGNRYVWPHVLDEVAKALPPYTWLLSMTAQSPPPVTDTTENAPPPQLKFRLEGRTMDLQAYTRFLRQLEASPWLNEVTPVEAKTVLEKERPVTAFTIMATFSPADSAYIRTVPLSQSVR